MGSLLIQGRVEAGCDLPGLPPLVALGGRTVTPSAVFDAPPILEVRAISGSGALMALDVAVKAPDR